MAQGLGALDLAFYGIQSLPLPARLSLELYSSNGAWLGYRVLGFTSIFIKLILYL